MMTLRGKIICETKKAVLFEVQEDICLNLKNQTEWFPRSKVKLRKLKTKPGYHSVTVPNWLYDRKIKIDPLTI